MNIKNLTIKKARELLDKKEISVRELAESYLQNVEDKNKELNAYLEVYDDVLKQAEAAQKIIDAGNSKALTGIPFAIKDCILIEGKKASAASKILENYTATYSASAVQKINDQSAVWLGRTNMDEFACGGSTENSAFGVVRNPYDTERVAGGSSGGSAAVVAAEMALGALGSDTGGSVREPASFCGAVGLKPTYGAVSRYGLMAMGSSLDVIGPLAKTVSDAEVIFSVIGGQDPLDSTTISKDTYGKNDVPKRFVIGVPYDFAIGEGVNSMVVENFKSNIVRLEKMGCEIREVQLPNIRHS